MQKLIWSDYKEASTWPEGICVLRKDIKDWTKRKGFKPRYEVSHYHRPDWLMETDKYFTKYYTEFEYLRLQ